MTGNGFDAVGLDEGYGFKNFIQRAEAAGHADIGLGVFDEHDLAHEKVFELELHVGKGVGLLLHGKPDIEPDRPAAAFAGALVAGLHDARPAARDDIVAGLGKLAGDKHGFFIGIVARLCAGRAEDAYAGVDVGKAFKAVDELGHDFEQAPGIAHVKGVKQVLLFMFVHLRGLFLSGFIFQRGLTTWLQCSENIPLRRIFLKGLLSGHAWCIKWNRYASSFQDIIPARLPFG